MVKALLVRLGSGSLYGFAASAAVCGCRCGVPGCMCCWGVRLRLVLPPGPPGEEPPEGGGSSGVGRLPQPGKGAADVLSGVLVETLSCDAIRKGVW